MKNTTMAEAYMRRAEACLREAKGAMKYKDHPGVVRRAQECVEFSLKGALRLYGIEYLRRHDVSGILPSVSNRFPVWFREALDELGEISSELAKHRGPSVYGDEEKGIPPSELFGKSDASKALRNAEFVYKHCRRLFREFLKKMRVKSVELAEIQFF